MKNTTDGRGLVSRRSFALGAFGTSAALMLAACGGGGSNDAASSPGAASSGAAKSTSATLTVWVDAERAPALKGIASKFKDEKGIAVKLVVKDFAAVRDECELVEEPALLEARTRHTARMGRAVTRRALAAAVRSGERVTAGLERVLDGYDLLLTPTLACLPPRIGQLDARGSLHAMTRSMPMIEFTAICNVSGHPAASIPGGLSREGLPIGVQVIGHTGGEAIILALAGQIERASRWPRPPG